MLLNALPCTGQPCPQPQSLSRVSAALRLRDRAVRDRAVSSLYELFSDLTSGSDARALNSVSGASMSHWGAWTPLKFPSLSEPQGAPLPGVRLPCPTC